MFQGHKSTGITNILGIGLPINRYLISGMGGDFIFSPHNPDGLRGLIRTSSQWKQRALSPELRVEPMARETGHKPPPSDEIKGECGYTFSVPCINLLLLH